MREVGDERIDPFARDVLHCKNVIVSVILRFDSHRLTRDRPRAVESVSICSRSITQISVEDDDRVARRGVQFGEQSRACNLVMCVDDDLNVRPAPSDFEHSLMRAVRDTASTKITSASSRIIAETVDSNISPLFKKAR